MSRLSMREFKEIVRQVMETLPPEFEPYLRNVTVNVIEEPDEAFLRKRAGFTQEEIDAGETLLGLFDFVQPSSMMADDAIEFEDLEHVLWIFKGPLEDEYPDRKRLRIEIRKTVIHELAHHFGWTDRDLEKFDDHPDPFSASNKPRRSWPVRVGISIFGLPRRAIRTVFRI
jgi:predicted Zn-dependent protease with MMP-like domain